MTLEERAKAYKEEVHKKYLEAEENGYMPSLWANVDNIWLDGYKEALKAKVITTTVSDAPLMEREQLEQAKGIIKGFIDAEDGSVQYYDLLNKAEQFLKELVVQEARLCEYCDQYKSCPDGKRCRTCDNGSKWKRRKEND